MACLHICGDLGSLDIAHEGAEAHKKEEGEVRAYFLLIDVVLILWLQRAFAQRFMDL